ncbi:MAG TPA: hypothetical protein VHI13_21335 [Candidatus Kapabacteria bacterium]|nr:hypothetical protein [Candidatus Kapabacteria bacterium]
MRTMRENRVHIDGLEIRVKGVSPAIVREAMEGLGDELAGHLAGRAGSGGMRSARIESLDAGSHTVAPGAPAAALRRAIVERLGDEIERRINQ